jgi:hypothetical protein
MDLGLSRRAVYHWIQTAQLDRHGAQSLPRIGRGLRFEFHRRLIAAVRDGLQENRRCLDGHVGAAGIAASGRRHRRPSSKHCRNDAARVKEQRPVHTRHRRYPRHWKTRGRTDTALAEHTLG